MQRALLAQIPQPILAIGSTTGHRTQQTRNSNIRRHLILTAAQPRHGNDLLDRLTGDPVTGGGSGICSDDLEDTGMGQWEMRSGWGVGERRTIPPWNRKASVVVPWASLIGQLGLEWSSVMARRKPRDCGESFVSDFRIVLSCLDLAGRPHGDS